MGRTPLFFQVEGTTEGPRGPPQCVFVAPAQADATQVDGARLQVVGDIDAAADLRLDHRLHRRDHANARPALAPRRAIGAHDLAGRLAPSVEAHETRAEQQLDEHRPRLAIGPANATGDQQAAAPPKTAKAKAQLVNLQLHRGGEARFTGEEVGQLVRQLVADALAGCRQIRLVSQLELGQPLLDGAQGQRCTATKADRRLAR